MKEFELLITPEDLETLSVEEISSTIIERARECECLEQLLNVFHYVLLLQGKLFTIHDQREELGDMWETWAKGIAEFEEEHDEDERESLKEFYELQKLTADNKQAFLAGVTSFVNFASKMFGITTLPHNENSKTEPKG